MNVELFKAGFMQMYSARDPFAGLPKLLLGMVPILHTRDRRKVRRWRRLGYVVRWDRFCGDWARFHKRSDT